MTVSLSSAVANFGSEAKAKLSNPGATGEPEDQLRAPLESLFADLAELCGLRLQWAAAVGVFGDLLRNELKDCLKSSMIYACVPSINSVGT